MSDKDFAGLLIERMKEIASEIFREEIARSELNQSSNIQEVSKDLREKILYIKAKENITVKEAALLLSCSESHIRKLVMLARKGKSRRPIPFVDIEGVTIFPLRPLLEWSNPKTNLQAIKSEAA